MERMKITGEYRDDTGKGVARKLRKDGKIPAVIYGHKKDPVGLAVKALDLNRIVHGHRESVMVDLTIKGKASEKCSAIIRDVQIHPATGAILHVDFQRVDLDEKVRVGVSIILTGDAKGVKDGGGILEHGLREVNVICTPTTIPETLEIDVSDLDIGHSIHIRDIAVSHPELEFVDPPDSALATVVPPIVEVKPEAAEEAAEEEAEEPELIAKEKEEGEAEEQG
jgi:large subunit ribosomal protein L25